MSPTNSPTKKNNKNLPYKYTNMTAVCFRQVRSVKSPRCKPMYFPSFVRKSGRSVNSVGAAKEHPMDPYFGCFVCWDFKVHGQYFKKPRINDSPEN